MKYPLLITCLVFSIALSAQPYTRDWRSCYDNGRVLEPRLSLQASAIDAAGNLYTAGFVNLKHDPVNDSVYLKKYSAAGKVLWEVYEPFRTTTSWSGPTPLTMITDKSGNIILSYSYSFVSSNVDAVINKYDSLGNRLWQTVFDGPADKDNEQAQKLVADDNGSIYLLMQENLHDYYGYGTIARFTGSGTLLWYQDMKGNVVNGSDKGYVANDATIDSVGNVYVTGYSNSSPKGERYNAFTYKFTANGSSAWRNRRNGNVWAFGYRVMYAKKDNSVVVCGRSTNVVGTPDSVIAVKYAAGGNGKQLWSYAGRSELEQTFDQSVIDADNNILIASEQTVGGIDYHAPYLTKLSASGAVLWAKYASDQLYYPVPLKALALKTDAASNYYLTTSEPEGILIQKFDKTGRQLAKASESIDTSASIPYSGLTIGKDQSIYTATEYSYYFARATKCVSKYSLKNTTAMVVSSDDFIHADVVAKPSLASVVYPNPAHDFIYVSLSSAAASQRTAAIFDGLGRQVLVKPLPGLQTRIDVSRLVPGVYVLKVNGSGIGQAVYKFVKE